MIMDLKKRLAELDRLTRKKPSGTGITEVAARPPGDGNSVGELGLQTVSTPFGPCYFRDHEDPVPRARGRLPDLGGFLSRQGAGGLKDTDVLFLDTETTGLAGGTGTLVFLVGASRWRGNTFHTRQFFLHDPAGEAALLQQLHRLAGGFRAVATFNGASFDLPLLRTRALLNRLDPPWDEMECWDLLVPARRLWGRRLPDCRQQTVERQVCDLERGGADILGQLIPQIWFDFLHQGRIGDLPRVFYHNRRDMTGLGHIFGKVVAQARTLAAGRPGRETSWWDAWSLGRIAEMRGQTDLSIKWLGKARLLAEEGAAEAFADPRFVADALRILKRSGNWKVVAAVIDRALDCGRNDWWLHREAAILYEHRLPDLDRARRHAQAAGDEHRLLRLRRKIKSRKRREEAQ